MIINLRRGYFHPVRNTIAGTSYGANIITTRIIWYRISNLGRTRRVYPEDSLKSPNGCQAQALNLKPFNSNLEQLELHVTSDFLKRKRAPYSVANTDKSDVIATEASKSTNPSIYF